MIRMLWNAIKGAVSGAVSSTNVGDIVSSIADLYLQRTEAKGDADLARIDAEIEVLKVQATQTANLQQFKLTAWIRPAFAAVVLFYVGKALVWDAALHFGTTDAVDGVVEYAAVAVIGFYFLTRPFEKYLLR